MENATKALYIAAGVLMGILILSLGVYLYFIFSDYTAASQKQIQNNQVATFNSFFLQYDQRNDLTVQDVVTVINYALECNTSYPEYTVDVRNPNGTNNFIDVYINNRIAIGNDTTNMLKDYLEDGEYNNGTRFSCRVNLSGTTGRVFRIDFTI